MSGPGGERSENIEEGVCLCKRGGGGSETRDGGVGGRDGGVGGSTGCFDIGTGGDVVDFDVEAKGWQGGAVWGWLGEVVLVLGRDRFVV